jgi:hypothetical protein
MVVKKRLTPSDDAKILDDWKKIYRDYKELGLSSHQAYLHIAKTYNCSHDAVRYWLRPDVRLSQIRKKKLSLVPYSKKSDIEKRRIHARVSKDIYRHINIYIREAYCGRDTPLSIDDLTLRLGQLSGILLRNKTLLNIVDQHEKKTGQKLLYPTGETPPRYYFRS